LRVTNRFYIEPLNKLGSKIFITNQIDVQNNNSN
jgi:hypothetical protein